MKSSSSSRVSAMHFMPSANNFIHLTLSANASDVCLISSTAAALSSETRKVKQTILINVTVDGVINNATGCSSSKFEAEWTKMGVRKTVRIKVNCPLLLCGLSRMLDSNKSPFHLVLVTCQYISPYFHCLLSPRQPAGSFITMKGKPIFSHTLLPFTLAHEFFIDSVSEASGLLVSVLDLIAPLFRPSLFYSAAHFCRLPTRKSKIFRSISLLTFSPMSFSWNEALERILWFLPRSLLSSICRRMTRENRGRQKEKENFFQ